MDHQRRRCDEFAGDFSAEVIGACIEVHRTVGPGLLESAYRMCLAQELRLRGLSFEQEKEVAVHYKGIDLAHGYRLDFVVEGRLIVEVKAVERLLPVHNAQLITYLRLTGIPLGLLANFHAETMRSGLRRLIQKPPSSLRAFAPSCSKK